MGQGPRPPEAGCTTAEGCTADRAGAFMEHRPVLFAIAYRMLGSIMDAEDIVQEAYLRWRQTSDDEVRSPRAFLTTVVTRLCIDHLRSVRAQREEYVGPWLPEPLLTEQEPDVAESVELGESVTMAFLALLERLTPVERAVFLLHDVFGYDYAEIAALVGKSPANCRQLGRRARARLAEGQPRFDASRHAKEQLTRHFLRACLDGDLPGLLAVLADDITLWSDGGGKAAAARRPVYGSASVARFLVGLVRQAPRPVATRMATINGEPGIIVWTGGRLTGVLALDIRDGHVAAIRIVVNPDKLRALAGAHGSQAPA